MFFFCLGIDSVMNFVMFFYMSMYNSGRLLDVAEW